MLTDGEKKILEKIKRGLKPPSEKEFNEVIAQWLFGKNAEKRMRYVPRSYKLNVLTVRCVWQRRGMAGGPRLDATGRLHRVILRGI